MMHSGKFRPIPLDSAPLLRLDAEGRLMRSPAIEKLIDAARLVVLSWEASPMDPPASVRVLRHALADIDKEASAIGSVKG